MVLTSSAGRTRTRALTTPETAIAAKHHSAIAEKRRAATSICSPPRTASTHSAIRPPAHTTAAIRWMSRPLVATSWAPPDDE